MSEEEDDGVWGFMEVSYHAGTALQILGGFFVFFFGFWSARETGLCFGVFMF